METQAKLFIQEQIKNGIYELVWSYILDYENRKNPFEEKRKAISPWKSFSFEFIVENEQILTFAESLANLGIKAFDALHISAAVYAKCDYYITTDKKLLNSRIPEIKILSPIQFVNEMEDCQ